MMGQSYKNAYVFVHHNAMQCALSCVSVTHQFNMHAIVELATQLNILFLYSSYSYWNKLNPLKLNSNQLDSTPIESRLNSNQPNSLESRSRLGLTQLNST